MINVKDEIWNKAHDLLKKAKDMQDKPAYDEALGLIMQLGKDFFPHTEEPQDTSRPGSEEKSKDTFKPGGGVNGSLSNLPELG